MSKCKNNTFLGGLCQKVETIDPKLGCAWEEQIFDSTGKVSEKDAINKLKEGNNFLSGCPKEEKIRTRLRVERN